MSLHLEPHEAERRAVVEQHDEDDAARDVREIHRLLLALVEERVEVVLADQSRQLIVGAEIGGGERRERGRDRTVGCSPTVATSCPVRSTSSAHRALQSYRKRSSDCVIAPKSSSVNDQLAAPTGMCPYPSRVMAAHAAGAASPAAGGRARVPSHVVAQKMRRRRCRPPAQVSQGRQAPERMAAEQVAPLTAVSVDSRRPLRALAQTETPAP